MDDKASGEQRAAGLPDVTKVSLQELADNPALRASLEELVKFLRAGSPEIGRHRVS